MNTDDQSRVKQGDRIGCPPQLRHSSLQLKKQTAYETETART